MRVIFRNQILPPARIPKSGILAIAKNGFRLYKPNKKACELSFTFVDEETSRFLNKKYRGKPKPTNVLSFPGVCEGEIGDIVICYSIAKKEALKMNMDLNKWIFYLFAHGYLHLVGFDHKDKKEEQKMDYAVNRVLGKFV
jgi:probable rRNA maturation factor